MNMHFYDVILQQNFFCTLFEKYKRDYLRTVSDNRKRIARARMRGSDRRKHSRVFQTPTV